MRRKKQCLWKCKWYLWRIFPFKSTQQKGPPSDLATQHKILTPKQVHQRLQVAPSKVQAGNTSENLLNEIHQIIYSLYQAKEITKNV